MSKVTDPGRPHVWLAYVMYPVTTAAYWERALRQITRVTTLGPRLPESAREQWQLQNMKVPVSDQNIPTNFDVDLREILARTPQEDWPDVFIWVESVSGFLPRGLEALSCPKVCYVIDSHLEKNRETQIPWARQFDHVFVAQLEYVPQFQSAGGGGAHWLPLGCDREIHQSPRDVLEYEIAFVGSLGGDPRRALLLEAMDKRYEVHYERCFWDEMARVFGKAMLGFNHAVNHDLNMRFFELLSIGVPQLVNLAERSGQDRLFVPGEDYILYDYENFLSQIRPYLAYDEKREAIGQRGQKLAHAAHTYGHRVQEVLCVALTGQKTTPTPEEWRERSLAGWITTTEAIVTQRPIELQPAQRSIIIPVLDYAPASPFNIRTLLDDLKDVAGEVIVVFNSESVANEMKSHPRIDLSAVMSHNVGVPRAWNIGVHMASTPTLFFMNSDLQVSRKAVDLLQRALWTLPEAAVVGPQGGYTDLLNYCCLRYFDHGPNRVKSPTEVDDVSGFFFCGKRQLFLERKLAFWDELTPCFGEEWDLGQQVRQAGLKCYVVPTPGYAHGGSGTIRGLKTIPYLRGLAVTASKSHHRNKRAMWKKWGIVPPP